MSKQTSGSTAKLPPLPGNEVDAFLETLEHPLRDDLVRVRQLILSALPGITLRAKDEVQLIFHTGAKKKAKPKKVSLSARPEALVTWLDPDRALVTLSPSKLSAQRLAFTTLVREWVTQL